MFCRNCGNPMPDEVAVCTRCGQSLSAAQPSPANNMPPGYPAGQQVLAGQPTVVKKKRRGCLTALLILLAVLVAGGTALYFLLPGLFRPVDLGVATSEEAYASAMTKLRYTKDESPASGQQQDYRYTFGPPAAVDTRLSSEELTSFFNYNRPPYFPAQNVQVKIGTGSSANTPIEVSATLDRDYILNHLLGGQFSQGQVQDALGSIGITKLLPARFNVYVKAGGEIRQNRVVALNFDSASIMGFRIPDGTLSSAETHRLLSDVINKLLSDYNTQSGAAFESIRVEDGQIKVQGEVPSSLRRQAKP